MKLPSLGHCVGCGGLHLLRPFPGSLIVWLSEPSHSGLGHSAGSWLLPGPVWTAGAAAVSQCPVGLGWWSPGGPRCPGAAVSQPHQLAPLRPDFSITPCCLLCLDLTTCLPAWTHGAWEPGAAEPEPQPG